MLIAAVGPSSAQPAPFPKGLTWDWQLTEPLDLKRAVEVIDLHPGLVTADEISRIEGRGAKTICYVSVGTLEKTSPDRENFPDSVVGLVYGDWPDERFLDIRQRDILVPLMRQRFAQCRALGFDAIEPDNMDVHVNKSGFDISVDDALAYVLALAEEAHHMGLAIGQKNVPELTEALVETLDFAIAESCFQDGWCDSLLPYIQAEKAVFAAEYLDRPLDMKAACDYASRHGFSLVAKDRHLTRKLRGCGG